VIKAGETQTLIINANVANIIVDASHQLSITDIQATNNVEMDIITTSTFGLESGIEAPSNIRKLNSSTGSLNVAWT
jgi:hypothetical protein